MRVGLWLIAILLGLGFVVQVIKVRGSKDERAAIRHAIRVSFADLQRRDARALCSDFTADVEARLAGGPASSCAVNVAQLFRATVNGAAADEASRQLPGRLRVTRIRWHDDHATAVSVFAGQASSQRRWELHMSDGRWRIETATELQLQTDCPHALARQPVSGCTRLLSMREAG